VDVLERDEPILAAGYFESPPHRKADGAAAGLVSFTVVSEVLLRSPAQREGFCTDPNVNDAYVMWRDTPHAYVMVPPTARASAGKAMIGATFGRKGTARRAFETKSDGCYRRRALLEAL
jgi:hypothetical protein